jgi:hypothetical protein
MKAIDAVEKSIEDVKEMFGDYFYSMKACWKVWFLLALFISIDDICSVIFRAFFRHQPNHTFLPAKQFIDIPVPFHGILSNIITFAVFIIVVGNIVWLIQTPFQLSIVEILLKNRRICDIFSGSILKTLRSNLLLGVKYFAFNQIVYGIPSLLFIAIPLLMLYRGVNIFEFPANVVLLVSVFLELFVGIISLYSYALLPVYLKVGDGSVIRAFKRFLGDLLERTLDFMVFGIIYLLILFIISVILLVIRIPIAVITLGIALAAMFSNTDLMLFAAFAEFVYRYAWKILLLPLFLFTYLVKINFVRGDEG